VPAPQRSSRNPVVDHIASVGGPQLDEEGRRRQSDPTVGAAMKPRELARLLRAPASRSGPAAWASLPDAHSAARRRLPRPVLEFVDGGAEDEATLRANAASRDSWDLVPRVIRGVGQTDLTRKLLGEEYPLPFVLGPTGFTGVVRPYGELAVARAAARQGIPYVVSAAASNTDLAELVAANPNGLWFNYYPLADQGLGIALLDRAWELGFRVLVLTVDVPVAGWRERDVRNGFSIPPMLTPATLVHGLRHPAWTTRFLRAPMLATPNLGAVDVLASSSTFPSLFKRDLSWDDVVTLRGAWEGPVVIKGVLSVEDAVLAADHGLDGIVVSNHGGRQLDGAPAPLRVLEAIADVVRPRGVDVLMDSGVRRGRDIVTAVALGANGVMLGRPYLYGLAGGGQAGVERVVEILRLELHRCLHLLGLESLARVDRSVLRDREPSR
jgi:L-lactate dehydrogenase (cytochrome)